MRPRRPGKFEGAADDRLAAVLHKMSLEGYHDEELGSAQGFGWYALIKSGNKRVAYIVNEDSQGFFDYAVYTVPRAFQRWRELENEYAAYVAEARGEF